MILIIDFGSQFNQLIARRVRECKVYCQIVPPDIGIDKIKSINPEGIILSGGPSSIYDKNSPRIDKDIFKLKIPVLGICYGMQFMIDALGGSVKKSKKREYGFAELTIKKKEEIFTGIDRKTQSWMSHGDSIVKLPRGFVITAFTENTRVAATVNKKKKFYGLQFHPEVEHTVKGKKMIKNFLDVCGCAGTWTMKSFAKESIAEIKETVKDKRVILGLSGGVDSSVTALLIHKAIGKKLTCIFVDNGLLRKNERENLKKTLRKHLKINILFVNASNRFLKALSGVSDPEKKRKIIGKIFIDVFNSEAKKIKDAEFLAQGTLYPDIIESAAVGVAKTAVKIKTHHNVGGLPEKMDFKILEPLKMLFKDEVRRVGLDLKVPEEIVFRQPFPGPGLAIRILGEATPDRVKILQDADVIVMDEIRAAGYYRKVWQAFAVLLPIKTVGVQGDGRTYLNTVALRAVTSEDAMTANWARLPYDLLERISSRIINEVAEVNRVVYDISSKPPATIEWE